MAGQVGAGGVFSNLILYSGPRGWVYDGNAVVWDDDIGEMELSDVEGVGEEGFVGVEGGEEAGGGVDFVEGFSCSPHLEGLLDYGYELRVGCPAMGGVNGPIATVADLDGDAEEASGGSSRQAAMGKDEGVEAAFYVSGEVV